MKDLLSNSGLKISTEIETFYAGHFWIKHNPKVRSKFAKELIKLVRLPLLSYAALILLLKKESSFTKCFRSKNYLKNVINNVPKKSINTFSNESQNLLFLNFLYALVYKKNTLVCEEIVLLCTEINIIKIL